MSRDERVVYPQLPRGSIGPHDNSLIAHGMALYEFRRACQPASYPLFQAALNFRDYRLPENCSAALSVVKHDEPVQYRFLLTPQVVGVGSGYFSI